MELTPEVVDLIRRTADGFPWGPDRRRYMADTVDTLGLGQRQAQRSSAGDATPSARPCTNSAPA